MIVFPPAVVTVRTVNDAVKVPVAVVGGVACASGVISSGRAIAKRNIVFIVSSGTELRWFDLVPC